MDSVDRQSLGPAWAGRFLEAGESQIQNPLTPQPNGHMAGAQFSGNLVVVLALGGKQTDAGSSHQLLWTVRRLDEALKFRPLLIGELEWNLWTGHVQKMARGVFVRKYLFETLH